MKKFVALMLTIVMMFGLVACSNSPATTPEVSSETSSESQSEKAPEKAPEAVSEEEPWKIGIMTSSVSQGEESFRCAEKIVAEYGEEHVVVKLFPDNFTTEQETTISNAMSLASDPDMKVIIFCQGLIGTAAACQKIKEARPDIVIIIGSYNEAVETLTECCDIFYREDMNAMGEQLVARAIETGCDTIVHYSFPRHLANAPMAQRLELMKELAKEAGIEVVEIATPDPSSDGAASTQQFVLEDVPRQIERYGANTMFFGTNTAQLEPMIKACVEGKAYYYPSVESVFTAYPAALGLSVPAESQWDVDYYVNAIKEKLVEAECEGHMGCWLVPVESFWMNSAALYAVKYCQGETNGVKMDYDLFFKCMTEAAGGKEISYRNITEGDVTYENGFFIAESYEIF